jgi:hypothetical protein
MRSKHPERKTSRSKKKLNRKRKGTRNVESRALGKGGEEGKKERAGK